MKLYTYFRSSAAYRVRIAINLKGLAYEAIPVHLVRGGGEHLQPAYREINPAALLPALDEHGATLTQSLAILEYLEEVHPLVPLLPADALGRARVRALAQTVACDMHPLGNLRVLKYLSQTLQVDAEAKLEWQQHWMRQGFAALEALLAGSEERGRFCHGDTPTLADCCLIPQIFNALRFGVDMAPYPTLMAIDARCGDVPAFVAAHPSRQPDSE
jgi:maleylpyruvate isomerase